MSNESEFTKMRSDITGLIQNLFKMAEQPSMKKDGKWGFLIADACEELRDLESDIKGLKEEMEKLKKENEKLKEPTPSDEQLYVLHKILCEGPKRNMFTDIFKMNEEWVKELIDCGWWDPRADWKFYNKAAEV